MHPVTRELRTASLLTTYDNRYHVQYHNPELGVHVQKDTSMVPIGTSDLYRTYEKAVSEGCQEGADAAARRDEYYDANGRIQ